MNCMICGKEFESKRSSAKYCSANCRVKAGRVSVTEPRLSVTGPEVSVTKPEVSVTRLSVTEVSVTEPEQLYVRVSDTKIEPIVDKYHCSQAEIDLLPVGVTRPDKDGVAWSFEPKYHKIVHDLIHMTLKELKAIKYWIPCWRHNIQGSLV